MATNEREKDQDSKGPVKDQKDQWKQWMKAEREKDQGSTVSACPALNIKELNIKELRRICKTAFICEIKSWETPIQENQIGS